MTDFLPKMTHLRRMTFLSVNLPSGWNDVQVGNLAFEAPCFHNFMSAMSDRMPRSLRHVRYRHLLPKDMYGAQQVTSYHYCRQDPVDGRRWMKLGMIEGEEMFDLDLTPQVVASSRDAAEL